MRLLEYNFKEGYEKLEWISLCEVPLKCSFNYILSNWINVFFLPKTIMVAGGHSFSQILKWAWKDLATKHNHLLKALLEKKWETFNSSHDYSLVGHSLAQTSKLKKKLPSGWCMEGRISYIGHGGYEMPPLWTFEHGKLWNTSFFTALWHIEFEGMLLTSCGYSILNTSILRPNNLIFYASVLFDENLLSILRKYHRMWFFLHDGLTWIIWKLQNDLVFNSLHWHVGKTHHIIEDTLLDYGKI